MDKLQTWAISSKNVCVLARDRSDYHPELCRKNSAKAKKAKELQKISRYSFATLIADAWFDILDRVKKAGKSVEGLKKAADNKTMVAEYCGNQNYQHLVKYTEIDLIFYAIVENDSL